MFSQCLFDFGDSAHRSVFAGFELNMNIRFAFINRKFFQSFFQLIDVLDVFDCC